MSRTFVPAILIAGGTGLIQYHSIAFWSEHVSSTVGWAWSIAIEAGGLWLWYRPGLPSRLLGLVASILLLAGPLYQIAVPALDARATEQASVEASAQAAQRLRDEIAQDAQLLRTFAQNSQSRQGWLQPIERLQSQIREDREKLNALEAKQAKSIGAFGLASYGMVLLQALGLMLIQTVNVLAITHVSRVRTGRAVGAQLVREGVEGVEGVEGPVVEDAKEELLHETAHEEHARLRNLAEQVRSFIDAESLSIAKAAEQLGVDRQNLSFLLNWQGPGDRKPTAASLDRLAEALA